MIRFKAHSAPALAALALLGCGGGVNGGGTASRTAHVGVFVTDDLGAYDHVWVTLKSIALVGPAGTKTVYVDPVGKAVDLAGLHSGANSTFAFLGLGAAPAGVYTSVQATLDDDLTLFPAGATVGAARKFAGSVGGEKTLVVAVDDRGEKIEGDDDLVVDFDLARWTDDGTLVVATARVRDHEGLDDPLRHKGDEAKGTVSGLGAAGFTLSGTGAPIVVTIDANTVVFGDAATLADGRRVEVRGLFDPVARILKATSVKVENETHGEAGLRGAVSLLGVDAFDLTVASADGFLPASTTLHVVPGANVRYSGAHGATLTKDAFFAALTVGEAVEAEGAYDAATGTLTATALKVEAENEGGHGGGDDHGRGDHGGGQDG